MKEKNQVTLEQGCPTFAVGRGLDSPALENQERWLNTRSEMLLIILTDFLIMSEGLLERSSFTGLTVGPNWKKSSRNESASPGDLTQWRGK